MRAEATTPDPSASPYLRLSLKDANSFDSVPQLSRENTPLSQEAQLMTIARQLQRSGSEYIVISATNVLDQLFLAQFLHRACPDARLLFYSGDLLFEREIDNVPFVGTLTFTPYPLIGTGSALGGRNQTRAYPDSNSQAYFNAASYTIWDQKPKKSPCSRDTGTFCSLPTSCAHHCGLPPSAPMATTRLASPVIRQVIRSPLDEKHSSAAFR